jgi:predicted HTH domain antitoxin
VGGEVVATLLSEVEALDPFDIVLAFLYACRGVGRLTKVHVQKGLYLASKHLKRFGEVLEFTPYRLGPWSDEVSDVIDQLRQSGDLEAGKYLRLTERGVGRAESAWGVLTDREREVLKEVANFISKLTPDELLLYIYVVYGGLERSDAAERVLRRRKELAESIYRKGLVSLGLAAEIAGMTLTEFIEYLRRRGVKPYRAEVKDVAGTEEP